MPRVDASLIYDLQQVYPAECALCCGPMQKMLMTEISQSGFLPQWASTIHAAARNVLENYVQPAAFRRAAKNLSTSVKTQQQEAFLAGGGHARCGIQVFKPPTIAELQGALEQPLAPGAWPDPEQSFPERINALLTRGCFNNLNLIASAGQLQGEQITAFERTSKPLLRQLLLRQLSPSALIPSPQPLRALIIGKIPLAFFLLHSLPFN
jgi:hypothetical protein